MNIGLLNSNWSLQHDGIRCGPYVYLGKVVSDNARTRTQAANLRSAYTGENFAYVDHTYMHQCTRIVHYESCRVQSGVITTGSKTVYRAVRPFGSSIGGSGSPRDGSLWECRNTGSGATLFKEGMLYNVGNIWGRFEASPRESNNGTPSGVSVPFMCQARDPDRDFKLKTLGTLPGYWWDPSTQFGTLLSRVEASYPGMLIEHDPPQVEGTSFDMVFYIEAWAGHIRINQEGQKTYLLKAGEQEVDLWVTVFLM